MVSDVSRFQLLENDLIRRIVSLGWSIQVRLLRLAHELCPFERTRRALNARRPTYREPRRQTQTLKVSSRI
jgi:hypothetical protein